MRKVDLMDDLKSNFRSWEYDHDNKKDAEGLFDILMERHPDEDPEWVKEMAYHWVGYEEFICNSCGYETQDETEIQDGGDSCIECKMDPDHDGQSGYFRQK